MVQASGTVRKFLSTVAWAKFISTVGKTFDTTQAMILMRDFFSPRADRGG